MNSLKPLTLVIVGAAGLIIGAWLQSRMQPVVSVVGPQTSTPSQPVSVADVRLVEPATNGDNYRIEATLTRDGPPGMVDVAFALRNRTSGQRTERSGTVELKPGIALVVVAEIAAPRADYSPEVEVKTSGR
jgi:hypothetical protein